MGLEGWGGCWLNVWMLCLCIWHEACWHVRTVGVTERISVEIFVCRCNEYSGMVLIISLELCPRGERWDCAQGWVCALLLWDLPWSVPSDLSVSMSDAVQTIVGCLPWKDADDWLCLWTLGFKQTWWSWVECLLQDCWCYGFWRSLQLIHDFHLQALMFCKAHLFPQTHSCDCCELNRWESLLGRHWWWKRQWHFPEWWRWGKEKVCTREFLYWNYVFPTPPWKS